MSHRIDFIPTVESRGKGHVPESPTEAHAYQDHESNLARIMAKLPRPWLIFIENGILIIASMFLPLFRIIYYFTDAPNAPGGVSVVISLNGRMLGIFPWLITLLAVFNMLIMFFYVRNKEKLSKLKNIAKRPKKITKHLDSLHEYLLSAIIFNVVLFILMFMFYYTYLVNYRQSIPDPLMFLPDNILIGQLGYYSEPPFSYSWSLRLEYGSYILVGTALLLLVHGIINYRKVDSVKSITTSILKDLEQRLQPSVTSEETPKTVPEELVFEEIEQLEEVEGDKKFPPAPTPPPSQSFVETRPSRASTRFSRSFTPPRLRPCRQCHTEIPVSAKFCYECGAPAAAT